MLKLFTKNIKIGSFVAILISFHLRQGHNTNQQRDASRKCSHPPLWGTILWWRWRIWTCPQGRRGEGFVSPCGPLRGWTPASCRPWWHRCRWWRIWHFRGTYRNSWRAPWSSKTPVGEEDQGCIRKILFEVGYFFINFSFFNNCFPLFTKLKHILNDMQE